ncbi:MAG: tetratricopeptide repeat protein, partial [Candidatus Obscuribacterales bacterium]|nr:tetratricopeptide repeat protein [Candidatus Obscuribacterales bacterium]
MRLPAPDNLKSLSLLLASLIIYSGTPVVAGEATSGEYAHLSAEELVQEGVLLSRSDEHFKAIDLFSAAITKKPGYFQAHMQRARVRKLLGDFQAALTDLTKAIEIDSHSVQAYTERGWCYKKLNEEKKALADFDSALKLDSDYARALQLRASSKLKTGDYQGALADYNKYLVLRPNAGGNLSKLLLPTLNQVAPPRKTTFLPASKPAPAIANATTSDTSNDDTSKNETIPEDMDDKELAAINNKAAALIKSGR